MTDKTGPAFPQISNAEFSFTGMTLRDYFAGQALQTLEYTEHNDHTPASMAYWAYYIADAMLKVRDK